MTEYNSVNDVIIDVESIMKKKIGVWFPVVRAESGSDIFTERLIEALNTRGIRAEATWLPHRAEYAPWTVAIPEPPEWATVVHVNNWLHPRFIPCNLPFVTTLHFCVHDPVYAPYKSIIQTIYHKYWIKNIESYNIRDAKIVTAVSNYTATIAETNLLKKGIVTVHNGIDTNIFKPVKRNKSKGVFKVIYSGNWISRKGVELLKPIFDRLGDKYLLLYTEGRNNQEASFDLPINSKKLKRAKTPEEMAALYQQADALILPTRLEGFGLAAAEAMACGVPAIASKNTSLPEVINHGETGYLCETDDIDSFVNAIQTLHNDAVLWKLVSENSIKYVRNNFNHDIQTDKYIELYKSLEI